MMFGFGKITSLAEAAALAAPFVIVIVIVIVADAGAQGRVCAKRDKLVVELTKSHGETRQSVGLQRNNGVIETFANTDTGTWTIIVSLPTGVSCLVAAGEAFEKEAKQASLTGKGA
jgi:hypothetical protein